MSLFGPSVSGRLSLAELRRQLRAAGYKPSATFHGHDPFVGVVASRDGTLVGGRYFPAVNGILVYGHDDPEITRATVVHERAHWRSYCEECGGTRRSLRVRCRYLGEHDAEFYRRLEPLYRDNGVSPEAARAVEWKYRYPARWKHIERF